jgi:hypothetical protein
MGLYSYIRIGKVPTQKIPLPYLFNKSIPIQNKAPIAIIGDRMANKLMDYSNILAETISVNLDKPIKIDNLSKEKEGLHRTLARLKSLEKKPSIVIYHGASEEEIEYRFVSTQADTIIKNISYYENPKLKTVLTLLPQFSKFLFEPVHHVSLARNIIVDPNEYEDDVLFKRIQIHYKLYEFELEELIKHTIDNNIFLILLTTPVNPNVKPKKVCDTSITDEVNIQIKKVVTEIKNNDFKKAFEVANFTRFMAPSNAYANYLFARVSRKVGRKKMAYEAVDYASSYDCKRWRANGVYNKIIRNMAKKYEIFLFDYDQYIRDNWDKNETFLNELYPQDLFYQKSMKTLGRFIKKVLKL